jgi:DNA-directed RNA polymerase specialized sigma24 family protein
LEELSVREIARRLALTEAAVKTRAKRARDRIRVWLMKETSLPKTYVTKKAG